MALDSAAKRVGAAGVGRPWKRGPVPDAAGGALWRAVVGNVYEVAAFQEPSNRGFTSSVHSAVMIGI